MTLHSWRQRAAVLVAVCGIGVSTASAQSYYQTRFRGQDRNRDGVVSRGEWRGSEWAFRNHDLNGDGVLSNREFRAAERDQRDRDEVSPYQMGRDRGLQEGRLAGREDRSRGRWDLDGQRELLRADSGYRQGMGERDIYQAGYREGFMIGYREAFGRSAPQQGRAWRTGRDQGVQDGRRAGREDASRHHWDLEGQRELVMADAGYRGEMGSHADYEVGYREGFKIGYEEGFGRR